MKTRGILTIVAVAAVVALGGAFLYRFGQIAKGKRAAIAEKMEVVAERPGGEGKTEEHKLARGVHLKPEILQSGAVVVEHAKKARLGGLVAATGKVESNADRTAHVSPKIPGKVVRSARASGHRRRRQVLPAWTAWNWGSAVRVLTRTGPGGTCRATWNG
jgi:cobalt-zinc-cadmium efflux system membrane fusion protein